MAKVLALPRFIEEMYKIVDQGYNDSAASLNTSKTLRNCVRKHRSIETFNEWYKSQTWDSRWGSVLETFKHNWTEPQLEGPTLMDYIKFWKVVNQFQYLAINIDKNNYPSFKDGNIKDEIKKIMKTINDIKNDNDQNSTSARNPYLIHI